MDERAVFTPTIDEGAIRASVIARQALRREALLPALDVEAEVAHARAFAIAAATQAFLDAHSGERDRIRDEVLAEMRAVRGPGFPNGWSGHLLLGHVAGRRFAELMRERYGVGA